jgi:PTS system nitrogen regulatory IIA component
VGEPLLLTGGDDVAALVAASRDYDLLVLGAPPEAQVRGAFRGSFEDRVTEQATCAVLRVKAVSGSLHDAQTRPVKPYNVEDDSGRLRLPLDPGFRVAGLLEKVEVLKDSAIRTKAQLFRAFAQGFAERHPGTEGKLLEEALWEREKKQVTALGEGVAVPHVALDILDGTYVEVWVFDRPIPFLGVRRAEVDVCFFVVGPSGDRRVHLRTLARIGHLVLLPEFLPLIRASESAEELLKIISTHEEELEP